jgi:hypothetical protein
MSNVVRRRSRTGSVRQVEIKGVEGAHDDRQNNCKRQEKEGHYFLYREHSERERNLYREHIEKSESSFGGIFSGLI